MENLNVQKPIPTRGRYIVVLWLCGLSFILYLDRICMSQAVPPIQREFNLTNIQMSYVLMAFTLAYGLFEIPSGRMGDTQGPRSVLTRIVIWWSLFTGLTGTCTGLISLIIVRFLFGAGEAGAYPNAARIISHWFPSHERGRVQGLMLSSAQIGAAFAPGLASYLIETISWQWAFVVFGSVGFFWAFGFWWWFRDDPALHPKVNLSELDIIQSGEKVPEKVHLPIPWRAVLTNSGILLLGTIIILNSFYSYFYFSWFPKYLTTAREMTNIQTGWLASFVLLGSAGGTLVGGWLADFISRNSSTPVRMRCIVCMILNFTASATLFFGIRLEHPWLMACFLGISICSMLSTLPQWWSVALPQCGKHVGSLFGLMNGMGVFGAMFSQWFVGAYTQWAESPDRTVREQWDPLFNYYVISLILSGFIWMTYRYVPLKDE